MLKRNLIANYLGQGWRALMSLAFIPFYIKYLGIEAYGVIGLFAVLQAWLSLMDMGMKPTLGREMARFSGGAHNAQSIRNLLRSIEVISVVVAMLLVVIIWGASDWIANDWLKTDALSPEAVAQAFVVMAFVSSLRFIESIYVSSVTGLQRQVLENVVTSTMATVRGVGAVAVLAWVSPTLEAFFLWQAAVSVVTLIWLSGVVYRILPQAPRSARFSIQELKRIWGFASGMLGITFLGLLLAQLDKVLLSSLLSLESFGYYILAANVAQLLNLFTGPIVNAFYPRMAQLVAEGDIKTLTQTYHLAAQVLSVLVGSLGIVLILFSEPLLLAWTGDPLITNNAATLLTIIATGTLLNRFMAVPYRLQLAFGWTTLALRVNAVAVTLIVPALLFAAPKYGAIGAAYVWCGLNLGYFVVVIVLTHRRLLQGEAKRWYLNDVLTPLGFAFALALVLRGWLPEESGRILIMIFIAISAICAAGISSIFAGLIRPRLMREIERTRVSIITRLRLVRTSL